MRLQEWLSAEPGRTKMGLARAVGVRWRAIHRIATGQRNPSLATALEIERATGGEVSVAELLKPGTSATADTDLGSRNPEAAE